MVQTVLGANSLLSAIYGGMVAGPNAVEYIKGLEKSSDAISSTVFDRHVKERRRKMEYHYVNEWY